MAGTCRPIHILALSATLLCVVVAQASAASGSAAEKRAGMPANDAGRNMCATGMRQSPIDIEDTDAARMLRLGFQYKLSLVTLSQSDSGLSGAYGNGSSVYVGKDKFDLRNIAFRTPSEHRVLGRRFPAEIQFLHRSAEGRLAVVSVLVVEGRENLAFREIIERLPAGVGGSIADPKILMNARDLLPELGSYIRYSGSLTSAPCTEDVDWFVMSQPVRLSEGQIARVRGPSATTHATPSRATGATCCNRRRGTDMKAGYAISLCLLALLSLGGCGVGSAVKDVATTVAEVVKAPIEAVSAPSRPETDESKFDTIPFAAAYCKGDAEEAVATTREFVQKFPQSPKSHLLHGVALDLSGRGVMAYRALAPLAAARHGSAAVLKCGDEFIYSGTVSEVAQRRLFEIKTRLEKLGLIFPLPAPAKVETTSRDLFALAAMAPTRIAEKPLPPQEVKAATVVPPKAPEAEKVPIVLNKPEPKDGIPRPARKPSRGTHFVHLGSYKSSKMLDRGWQQLQKRFSKILGGEQKSVSRVDLGKKGTFLRLGVQATDSRSASRLCSQLKSSGQYCTVMRTGRS